LSAENLKHLEKVFRENLAKDKEEFTLAEFKKIVPSKNVSEWWVGEGRRGRRKGFPLAATKSSAFYNAGYAADGEDDHEDQYDEGGRSGEGKGEMSTLRSGERELNCREETINVKISPHTFPTSKATATTTAKAWLAAGNCRLFFCGVDGLADTDLPDWPPPL